MIDFECQHPKCWSLLDPIEEFKFNFQGFSNFEKRKPNFCLLRIFAGGVTENVQDVWGTAVPYLLSVPDPWSLDSTINPFVKNDLNFSDSICSYTFGEYIGDVCDRPKNDSIINPTIKFHLNLNFILPI